MLYFMKISFSGLTPSKNEQQQKNRVQEHKH